MSCVPHCVIQLDSVHTCRHDASEDVPRDLHGKLHKVDHTPYQTGLLRYMMRVCRRSAKIASEAKPAMHDIVALVKGCVLCNAGFLSGYTTCHILSHTLTCNLQHTHACGACVKEDIPVIWQNCYQA